jgi:hypothetical protein
MRKGRLEVCAGATCVSQLQFAEAQQSLNPPEARAAIYRSTQQGRGVRIIAFEKQQNPQVSAGLCVVGVERNQGLQLRNRQIGFLLLQILLSFPAVVCYLLLHVVRFLRKAQGYAQEQACPDPSYGALLAQLNLILFHSR